MSKVLSISDTSMRFVRFLSCGKSVTDRRKLSVTEFYSKPSVFMYSLDSGMVHSDIVSLSSSGMCYKTTELLAFHFAKNETMPQLNSS